MDYPSPNFESLSTPQENKFSKFKVNIKKNLKNTKMKVTDDVSKLNETFNKDQLEKL
jgi:hypothetical protein